ncbi:hypothetical protein E2N92_11220 [Methanofollis formosanus]|uniref:Uncharacterized protein n=1 Tax=Methanofollis formosanus TaxID=299308 RepID=A0A8G1EH91_9EURY|nr:hypothetical protein [Methanofollis formosanus]QYZ79951.1 hypothetical protein E2N92_11220 [Methanofollis formosanus]
MKRIVGLMIALFVAICCIQAAAATSFVDGGNYDLNRAPDVDPASGDLTPGQKVIVTMTVTFDGSGEYSFPADESLEFYSELENPKWSYNLEVDGREIFSDPKTSSARYVRLLGWDLSYQKDAGAEIEMTLEGKAPAVTGNQKKNIVRIRQYDEDDDLVDDSEYILTRTVISPQNVDSNLKSANDRLNNLKSSIEEKLKLGVDTTAAQKKYDEAKAALNRAGATTDYAAAQADLTTATGAMDAAESELSMAWARKDIDDAQAKINEIDGLISYFENEAGMKTDQRVVSLKTQRDIAAQSLSAANDKMNDKNYAAARIKGEEAAQKATSTLDVANTLKKEVGQGFSLELGSLPLYIGAGVLVVLIIGGIVYLRGRRKWDELG